MGRIGQHLETLHGVWFQWTMEDQEPIKDQITFDVIPVNVLDLARIGLHDLVTESQDSRTSPGKVLVRIVVVFRDGAVHLLERLRCSLDAGQQPSTTSVRSVDDGGHPLESGRELESPLDVDLNVHLGALVLRSDLISFRDLPIQRVQRGTFHRIPHDGPVLEQDERVSGSESDDGILSTIRDGYEFPRVRLVHPGNTLDDEVFTGDGTRLVETTDIDLSSKRDPEGFGTEDGCVESSSVNHPRTKPNLHPKTQDSPNLLSATREALTAMVNSIGNSGGTTEVRTSTTSSNNFPLSISFFLPSIQT
jgi:hypothetical protein